MYTKCLHYLILWYNIGMDIFYGDTQIRFKGTDRQIYIRKDEQGIVFNTSGAGTNRPRFPITARFPITLNIRECGVLRDFLNRMLGESKPVLENLNKRVIELINKEEL